MGMTMTQKILADHAGVKEVHAGELIEANVDIVMANDITGPMALPIFKKMADKVFDKDKVVLTCQVTDDALRQPKEEICYILANI